MAKQYHKSNKVCGKCEECGEEVCGISQSHFEECMKLHKSKSKLHKKIVNALVMSGAVQIGMAINNKNNGGVLKK